jgi:hypothetical protein
MLETITSGVLGSLVGGAFRLAPELLKLVDKKDERKHELKMFTLQTDLEKVKGEYRMEEKYVDFSVAQLQAIESTQKTELEALSKAPAWVAAMSALVRPIITYLMFALYIGIKIAFICQGIFVDPDEWALVLAKNWTNDDIGMLMMILTFHFVGRPLEKYNK